MWTKDEIIAALTDHKKVVLYYSEFVFTLGSLGDRIQLENKEILWSEVDFNKFEIFKKIYK